MSKRWAVVLAVAIVLLSSAPAWAGSWHRGDRDDDRRGHSRQHDRHNDRDEARHGDRWGDHSGYDSDDDDDYSDDDESEDDDENVVVEDEGADVATDDGVVPADGTDVAPASGSVQAELTGYSYQDNTPPGSADISMPVIHKKAGGTGTFADPITTAVPGSGGKGAETPKGTKIYVPKIKRYIIVEDTGATAVSGVKRFDIWVGGEGFSKSASDKCMNSFTGKASVEINPPAGRPVTVGALTNASGCKI